MRIHPLITKTGDLKALVDRLSKQPFVAVDTEFMREILLARSMPDPGSVDRGGRGDRSQGRGIDLKPLLDLFVERRSAEGLPRRRPGPRDHPQSDRQGPIPLFDTQIAAMALGHGEQIGYSNLIESLLGHSLDKGARFTDWSRRPLDKRQIDYAIADVTHLATIFPRMVEKLKKTGRGAWLDEEMERLADPSSFAFEPEDAWKRLKLPSRNPAVLGRLKALAAWRETEARSKNFRAGGSSRTIR
jgi:ribonuclease D